MILIIDNYDSFTYNIVQYIGELAQECLVYRNDAISIDQIRDINPSHIIISPGPGSPCEAGISNEIIKELKGEYNILGVCLGHQCIGEIYGAKVVRAPYLMHGKTSKIIYDVEEHLFENMPDPFTATRYHSLIIDRESIKNSALKMIAWTSDDLVMGVRHRDYPNLLGVQFHPESILTEGGHTILKNFLNIEKTLKKHNQLEFSRKT